MTQRNVEILIGRLATDPALRARFTRDPAGALRELCEQGHELTAVEIDALAAIDAADVGTLADKLDRRIQRLVVRSKNPQPK